MINRAEQEWPEDAISEQFRVIERGRTTGWIYAVTIPLTFARAENFAFELRQVSKTGGHEVSCYFVVPATSSVLPDELPVY